MSKKSWAPPQKGTELFPVTGQVPIRLLVKGVPPGSVQERELVAAHEGILSQFIAKQRHAYSLSVIPIHRGMIERDNVRMTYHNQQGVEVALIEVRPQAGGGEAIEDKAGYALIDLTVDNEDTDGDAGTRPYFYAVGRSAPGRDLLESMFATAEQGQWVRAPVAFARTTTELPVEIFDPVEDDGRWRISLRVDCRTQRRTEAAIVDLYGYVAAKPPIIEEVETDNVLGTAMQGYVDIDLIGGQSTFFTLSGLTLDDWSVLYPEIASYDFFLESDAGPMNDWAELVDNSLTIDTELMVKTMVGNSAGNHFNHLSGWNSTSGWAGDNLSVITGLYQPSVVGAVDNFPDTAFRGKATWRFGYYATYSGTKVWPPAGAPTTGSAIAYGTMPDPPPINGLPSGTPPDSGFARAGTGYKIFYHYPDYEWIEIVTPVHHAQRCEISTGIAPASTTWGVSGYPNVDTTIALWEDAARFPRRPTTYPLETVELRDLQDDELDGGTPENFYNMRYIGRVFVDLMTGRGHFRPA